MAQEIEPRVIGHSVHIDFDSIYTHSPSLVFHRVFFGNKTEKISQAEFLAFCGDNGRAMIEDTLDRFNNRVAQHGN